MTGKTAVPEYCRGGKKIRAYQCGICDRLDVDDACSFCPFYDMCRTEPYTWEV